MLIVTAPMMYDARINHTTIFLAGGINKCWEWQQACLDEIERLSKEKKVNTDNMIIYNPRRPYFKTDAKPRDIYEQVQWEYHYLESCDVFSMYFCESESTQPICMYELGRNVVKKQQAKDSIDRVVVSAECNYSRYLDVAYQLYCAFGENDGEKVMTGMEDRDELVKDHAQRILEAYMKDQAKKLGWKRRRRDDHRTRTGPETGRDHVEG